VDKLVEAVHVKVRAPVDGTDYDVVDGLTAKKGEIYDAIVIPTDGHVMAVSIPSLAIDYALTNEGDTTPLMFQGCGHLNGEALWELIR
jgi:hypothetical protein